jgi:hypothetical protein
MMTYKKLYHRIRESTGLDVLTENVLQTIIENCFADITSRGYREFNEQVYVKEQVNEDDKVFENLGYGLYCIDIPEDYRRTLHLKVTVNNKVYLAQRLALTDERINSIVVGNDSKSVRSNFAYLDKDAIFYIKGTKLFVETRFRESDILDIRLGYDKRLIAPQQPTLKNYDTTEIICRREFEDAIVLFGVYFLLQRYSKDTDRVQMALNNYKYYVEDLTYTLAYEDNYTDEDGIICLERV